MDESGFLRTTTIKDAKDSTIPKAKKKKKRESMVSSRFFPKLKKKKKSTYTIVLTAKQEDDIFLTDKMYSYITIDYAHNTYYWDSFFFASNLILISVSVGSHKIDTLFYAAIIIGIFTLMLIVSKNIQPFRYSEINNLMCYSYFVLITTFCFVANLTFLSDRNENLSNFYFSLILIINSSFYFYWFYLLIHTSIIPKMAANLKKLKEKLLKRKTFDKEKSKKETRTEDTIQTKKEFEGLTKISEGDILMIKTEAMKDEGSEREKPEIIIGKDGLKRIPKLAGDIISIYDD